MCYHFKLIVLFVFQSVKYSSTVLCTPYASVPQTFHSQDPVFIITAYDDLLNFIHLNGKDN